MKHLENKNSSLNELLGWILAVTVVLVDQDGKVYLYSGFCPQDFFAEKRYL